VFVFCCIKKREGKAEQKGKERNNHRDGSWRRAMKELDSVTFPPTTFGGVSAGVSPRKIETMKMF
jgi:hypothetical protein